MSELEQTIEELEAEVLAELEEASDAQTKGATPAEPKKKIAPITRSAATIEMFTGFIILRVKVMMITAATATKI